MIHRLVWSGGRALPGEFYRGHCHALGFLKLASASQFLGEDLPARDEIAGELWVVNPGDELGDAFDVGAQDFDAFRTAS